MSLLVLGLALFVLTHSVPMVPPLREALVARLGLDGWRGIHTALALTGLGLMIWGFGEARAAGAPLWFDRPAGMRHATLLVMLPVFPLIFSAWLPGAISARVGHPLVTAGALWAFGHLLSVGSAPAVTLFAVFLVWAVADRLSLARRQPRRADPPPFGRNDVLAIGLGVALWGVFVWRLHRLLIGVAPLG